MGDAKFIDRISIVLAGATLLASFMIFYRDTSNFGGSLAAAIMTAALVWGTYIVLRWLLLANRS